MLTRRQFFHLSAATLVTTIVTAPVGTRTPITNKLLLTLKQLWKRITTDSAPVQTTPAAIFIPFASPEQRAEFVRRLREYHKDAQAFTYLPFPSSVV